MKISADTEALVAAQLTQSFFVANGVAMTTTPEVVKQYHRTLALVRAPSDQKGSVESFGGLDDGSDD